MPTTKEAARKSASTYRWSHQVMETSDALDLESNIFESTSAKRIAASLKHLAESSKRRKGTPFQSAMSMLNFYINRAGHNLPELRRLFGKSEPAAK